MHRRLAAKSGSEQIRILSLLYDSDLFFEELLEYHQKLNEQFLFELSFLKTFIPGYPELRELFVN